MGHGRWRSRIGKKLGLEEIQIEWLPVCLIVFGLLMTIGLLVWAVRTGNW